MRLREANTKGRGSGKLRVEPAGERREPAHKNTDEALRDLRKFLLGQEHMPDVPLQMDDLLGDIEKVMDDELITSMECVLEDASYVEFADNDPTRMMRYERMHLFLKKLRDLQKTRLRDAIARAVVRKFN